jgi:hypothetical protein
MVQCYPKFKYDKEKAKIMKDYEKKLTSTPNARLITRSNERKKI